MKMEMNFAVYESHWNSFSARLRFYGITAVHLIAGFGNHRENSVIVAHHKV